MTILRLSLDGLLGMEITVVTKLQEKITITMLKITISRLNVVNLKLLRCDAYAILGFSTKSLLKELAMLTPLKIPYDAKVGRHIFCQVRASRLTRLASKKKGISDSSTNNTKKFKWTYLIKFTPNFLNIEIFDKVFYLDLTFLF